MLRAEIDIFEKAVRKIMIKEVVDKIESMRVKFADITKNYTTMDLMNELWDYQRKLKKELE